MLERNELIKLNTMLNNSKVKYLHEFKSEIKHNGIYIYPTGNEIYNLHSLTEKILNVIPMACIYISFKYKYIRII